MNSLKSESFKVVAPKRQDIPINLSSEKESANLLIWVVDKYFLSLIKPLKIE